MSARAVVVFAALAGTVAVARAEPDPLPSWNEGAAKQAIATFVRATTDRGSPTFVRPEERIATFDQDGTLWVEHPLYTQAMFALDRVRALAPRHPGWKTTAPFRAVLAGDRAAIEAFGEHDWAEIIAATHAGVSIDAFRALVEDWLAGARHPRWGRPYTDLAYQPMVELMRLLRANGFRTYIVTGGGQEFVRAYAERVYGVQPDQVIGSSILTRFEVEHGRPALMREPKVFFIDDHGGKPVGINLFIGRRPIAAFGNSDGDAEMLRWTQAGGGAHLMMLVHHDDAEREYVYGADTKVGTFSDALAAEARRSGWTVVSMKRDWKRIFAFKEIAGR